MKEKNIWKKLTKILAIVLVLGLTIPAVTTAQTVPVQAATRLAAKKKTLTVGKTYTLKLKGNKKSVKWYTSNKNVKITKKTKTYAKLQARKKGKTTVTAKIGKKRYKCYVTVKESPKISKSKITLGYKKTYNLSVSGASSKPKWYVSNKKILSVKKLSTYKYRITTKKKGTAYVYCKVAGKKLRCRVSVKDIPKLNRTSVSLYAGKTYNLTLTGSSSKPRWSSSNSGVASLRRLNNNTYQVRANRAGSATIYAKSANKTLKCRVYVKAVPTPKPVAKPTARPTVKPTVKPTQPPVKPTATPKPTQSPKPTATPTPLLEPSAEMKAALNEITGKDYQIYGNWINVEIIKDSRFKFTTDKNDTGENVVYVSSSDSKTAWVDADPDNTSALLASAADVSNKTVTLTFRLGSYTRTCKLNVVPYADMDLTNVPDADLAAATTNQKAYAQEVFRLINEYRVANGREALEWEERYCLKSASAMAGYDIIKGMKTFEPADLADHGVGQIGYGSTGTSTPKEAVDAWINSEMHKANILDKKIHSIGVSFLTCKYGDGLHTDRNATTVICTLGPSTANLAALSDDEILDSITDELNLFIKTKDDLKRYLSMFYHPSVATTTMSAETSAEPASNGISTFSDGVETEAPVNSDPSSNTDAEASEESAASVEVEPETSITEEATAETSAESDTTDTTENVEEEMTIEFADSEE